MSRSGIFAPLRTTAFRNIWLSSLASNAGNLIQSVGVAWAMASISTPEMVAMVQTATFLPIALFAVPAGAISDMYDRRKIQLIALVVAMVGATGMTLFAAAGLMTPWALLGFCFIVGSGTALFGAAWQSSPGEQVAPEVLPQAIALNGISYNVGRSFGPAVGGMIVAAAGAQAAFATNALCYLPIILALIGWRRVVEPSRLPPERLDRAIVSGVRYILNMRPARSAVIRSVAIGFMGASLAALLPLVARDLLSADARIFGLLLTSLGVGGIGGIFVIQPLRKLGNENAVRLSSFVLAAMVAVVAMSKSIVLTAIVLVPAGAASMVLTTTVNIALQLFVPRWVAGRVVASLTAMLCLGLAFGGWFWGGIAQRYGIEIALLSSAVLTFLSPLLGFVLRIENREFSAEMVKDIPADPQVKLGITGRSGPIVVELEYRIPLDRARDFYNLMREIQRIRHRNGAYDWTVSRDIADPELWSERFRCPTWSDFLRLRARRTTEEALIQNNARNLHFGVEPVRVRHWLERPFGSVRWRSESPDHGV